MFLAGSYNGSTADSESAYLGSPARGWSASGGESQVSMYYVYVLQSLTFNTRYVGSTADIEMRLIEHNSGRVLYTKGRKPWKLIYSEEFTTRSDARRRELFLKSGQGRKYLDTKLSTVNH